MWSKKLKIVMTHKKKKTIVGVSVFFLLSLTFMPSGVAENSEITYERLKAEQHGNGCAGIGSGEQMRAVIAQNFDPKCLSNSRCRVALKIVIRDDGTYEISKLKGIEDTPSDDFYCEQAVWEYAIAIREYKESEFLCEFSALPSEHSGSHPELLSRCSLAIVY